MEFEDIANLINQAAIEREGRPLKDVERLVLKGAWHNQTYGTMAKEAGGYTEDYLKKDVGPKLWRLLSELIDQQGIRVTKRNIQNVLQHWAVQTQADRLLKDETSIGVPSGQGPNETVMATAVAPFWTAPSLEVSSSSRLDVTDFVGRQQDLGQIKQWLQEEACRSLLIWGLPGVGKTTLATKVLAQLSPKIETRGYLSLTADVHDDDFFAALVRWLKSGQYDDGTPLQDPLNWVLQQFESRRCVLVVDQLEALFQPGQPVGTFREGTSAIQQFFQMAAEQRHQSSVLWVSREKSLETSQWRGGQIREYQLQDLSLEEAKTLLQARGLQATEADWQTLLSRYGGSPLLLKGLAATIQEVYQSQVAGFLAFPQLHLPTAVVEGITQALQRLPQGERDILYWLAIAHVPVPLTTLMDGLVKVPDAMTIQSLLGRALCHTVPLERKAVTGLAMDSVVRAIVLDQLQSVLLQELSENRVEVLNRIPLVTTTAREGVQLHQRQALLEPLGEALRRQYGIDGALSDKCQQLHQTLRHDCLGQPGYGAGNFIHLCQTLEVSLHGIDLSELSIWQSDLRFAELQGADLSHAKFADTVFATALGRNPVMAFSIDGEYLATGDQEGRLLLWELHQGKLMRVLHQERGQGICALAFSPRADLLAVGTDSGQIWLWSLQDSYHPDGLFGHDRAVRSLAFSPDGSRLASGDATGQLYLWDLASGIVQGRLHQHQGMIHSLAFDAQGQTLVSGGDDQRACLWDVMQQTLVKEFQAGSTAQIRVAGFMADPQWSHRPLRAVAAGYDEQSLTLWDIEAGRSYWAIATGGEAILAIALSRNGQDLLCSYQDFSVALWNLPRRQIRYRLPRFNAPVWSMAFSVQGHLFVTGGDYTIKLWETASGSCVRSFLNRAHPVRCLALSDVGNTLITGHSDYTLRLWQVNSTGTFAFSSGHLLGHRAAIRDIVVSPDGQWLASSGEDLTIRLWDLSTKSCERVIPLLSSPVNSLAFSPDSRWLATAGAETAIILWDVASGDKANILDSFDTPPSALLFSPDGDWLFIGCRDGRLYRWALGQGRGVQLQPGHKGRVHSLAQDPAGTVLASASHDGHVYWRTLDHPEVSGQWCHPEGHWLQVVTVTPQQEIWAITSQTHQIEVWDVKANHCRYRLEGHGQDIWQVAVSSDRTMLATASQDDEIRIWPLDTGVCLQTLRPDRPYEGVNILGAEGLSVPEGTMLRALGAVERHAGGKAS
jgi:WD40 repeat protein